MYHAALYILLDERGGYLFTVDGDVFYRHIPHAVFLVLGVVFERGRLALCPCAEAEIFAAHIGLYVDVLLEVAQKFGGRSLFKILGIVDFEHELCFVLLQESEALFESKYLPAALTFGKHHYAHIEAVYLGLQFCLFQELGVADMYRVEAAEHYEGGKIIFVPVVIYDL